MNNDDLLDYWEEENWTSANEDDLYVSIYSLPLVAAGLVSAILVVVLAVFVRGRGAALADPDPPLALPPSANAVPPVQEGGHFIAPLFTPSVQFWDGEIRTWAAEWGLEPNLVATVMQIESCGHPEVVSSAGATGLFQVMPFHFNPDESHVDPGTNAARGLSYLSRSLAAHSGEVYYALAGYNAGISGSQRSEALWPAETKRYTYWGSGIYADAVAGVSSSARLEEWLSKGGASLCRRAEERLGLAP